MSDLPNSFSEFCRIDPEEWKVTTPDGVTLRQELNNAPDYRDIIDQLSASISNVEFHREQCKHEDHTNCFRLSAKVTFTSSELVTYFHSASSGYRAQYYSRPEIGAAANRYAVTALMPGVLSRVEDHPKSTCPTLWAKLSLADESAKAWIYQGLWARTRWNRIKVLSIERWRSATPRQDDPDVFKSDKTRIRLSPLSPDNETRIEVKGGWLTLDCVPLGTLKRTRAQDIHNMGFS